jgi:hypothetical protein
MSTGTSLRARGGAMIAVELRRLRELLAEREPEPPDG